LIVGPLSIGFLVRSDQKNDVGGRSGKRSPRGRGRAPGQRPWEALDPALAPLLERRLVGLDAEIASAVGSAIPEYRKPMSGAFGAAVRVAIVEALGQFTAMIGKPGPAERSGRQIYINLGRGELRAGRSLDALQAAYRLGARIAWRRIGEVALESGVEPQQLSLLAEAIFAYIDELSAESVEGYARAQAATAGERQGRREHVVRLLLAASAPPEEIEHAVAAAGWKLPRKLAALACEYYDPQRLELRTAVDAIAAQVDGVCCLLVPDPDAPGRRDALADALTRVPAAIGPTVPWDLAGASFARARECLTLMLDDVLPVGGLTVGDEKLAAMVVFRDRELVAELAQRRLAPLVDLTPAQRTRLEQTLLHWLRHQGNIPATADALHVHRQTVRYRLTRLRELFGDALDDPEARFELELALRGRVGVG
jgi:hypothetical protein